jgi:dTDP-glucose 4,6-dehydratase
MTTLLLTGAGGFLGSHVLESALRRTDWNVICIDSFQYHSGTDRILQAMTDVPETEEILNDTRKRVRLLVHDLNAPFSTQQIAQLGRVDLVVHAAALCSVDQSIVDPRGHVLSNISSALTMLELARLLKPVRYLHVSTDEVFGPELSQHPGEFECESLEHRPSSPYAASKGACEDICHAYRTTYDVPVTIVNSANIFGERQSQLAFIPKAIHRILAADVIDIHTDPDGVVARRWYSYAPNVADWIVQNLTNSFGTERHLLAGQVRLDMIDLAEEIAFALGRPLRIHRVVADEVRPGWDVAYSNMPPDPTWKPSISFEEGLKRTTSWFIKHEEWLR